MASPKDSWLMAIVDLVIKIIVPITILIAGNWLTTQQKKSETEVQMFKTSFDSVTKLASQNQKERLYAAQVLNNYAQVKTLPRELTPVLVYIAKNDPDREVAQEAAQAAKVFIDVNKPTATETREGAEADSNKVTQSDLASVQASLDRIPTLVYIHVLNKSQAQHDDAERIMQGLKEKGVNVPSIQWVDSVPTNTQLRYFHRDNDRDVIDNVIPLLHALGLKNVEPVDMSEHENSNAVKTKQYELWYGKPAP